MRAIPVLVYRCAVIFLSPRCSVTASIKHCKMCRWSFLKEGGLRSSLLTPSLHSKELFQGTKTIFEASAERAPAAACWFQQEEVIAKSSIEDRDAHSPPSTVEYVVESIEDHEKEAFSNESTCKQTEGETEDSTINVSHDLAFSHSSEAGVDSNTREKTSSEKTFFFSEEDGSDSQHEQLSASSSELLSRSVSPAGESSPEEHTVNITDEIGISVKSDWGSDLLDRDIETDASEGVTYRSIHRTAPIDAGPNLWSQTKYVFVDSRFLVRSIQLAAKLLNQEIPIPYVSQGFWILDEANTFEQPPMQYYKQQEKLFESEEELPLYTFVNYASSDFNRGNEENGCYSLQQGAFAEQAGRIQSIAPFVLLPSLEAPFAEDYLHSEGPLYYSNEQLYTAERNYFKSNELERILGVANVSSSNHQRISRAQLPSAILRHDTLNQLENRERDTSDLKYDEELLISTFAQRVYEILFKFVRAYGFRRPISAMRTIAEFALHMVGEKVQISTDVGVGGSHFSAPSKLASPDEFKNPSCYLKVYGDPLCKLLGSSSFPQRGVSGNWPCSRCDSINFPRRFSCKICGAPQSKEGKEIVRQYVWTVHQQHVALYKLALHSKN